MGERWSCTAAACVWEHGDVCGHCHERDLAAGAGTVELPGACHRDVPTMNDTHVLNRGGLSVRSPIDRLLAARLPD